MSPQCDDLVTPTLNDQNTQRQATQDLGLILKHCLIPVLQLSNGGFHNKKLKNSFGIFNVIIVTCSSNNNDLYSNIRLSILPFFQLLMASVSRTFFPQEIHDILDQSDDFDDEVMMK